MGEIQNNSEPTQWRRIPTEHNVVDDVSRGVSVKELSRRWQHGPEFFCHPEDEWPEKPTIANANDIVRVGGRNDKALTSYDSRYLILLPREHWVSTLVTRTANQYGHTGVATTAAKLRKRFWIIRARDLAKSVKFRCKFCRQMEAKVESQVMADLPKCRLAPFTPPFYHTSCDYFGPFSVKITALEQCT